jgi:hypothetical protein
MRMKTKSAKSVRRRKMSRKRFVEMTVEELTAIDNSQRYIIGRSDAFDHGKPETILEYWEREEPSNNELVSIIKNILNRMIT